ncbi:MAG: hypothetical protein ACUVQ5_03860 [Candidatus Methanomethylicaceae archaeon]
MVEEVVGSAKAEEKAIMEKAERLKAQKERLRDVGVKKYQRGSNAVLKTSLVIALR